MSASLSAPRLLLGLALAMLLMAPGAAAPPARAEEAEPKKQAERDERWAQNHVVTELWSGPNDGAEFFGWLRRWSYLRIDRWEGERLYVFNPRSNNWAFVNASTVGPSGPPPADYLEPYKVVEQLDKPARFIGTVGIYAEPVDDYAEWLRDERHNTPVLVEALVKGTGAGTWYRLSTGEFVEAAGLRMPSLPSRGFEGRWIDADLSDPTLLTAYEGDKPVYAALAIRGTPGRWQTPTGTFRIIRRVENETMSSETLGIPRDAPGGYHLKNVLFTQYFLGSGESLHYNYWSSNFGYPGSHGCLGMNYADSKFFWDFAEVGTPVVVRY